MRRPLPSRRTGYIHKARIDGQSFYMTTGEYEDGALGEIFIEAHKEGTFSRGVLSALARMTSIALQCGADVSEVVKVLKAMNFPPNGQVIGSDATTTATSVVDWIAKEIEYWYVLSPEERITKKGKSNG